jgi:hypothetical protein
MLDQIGEHVLVYQREISLALANQVELVVFM